MFCVSAGMIGLSVGKSEGRTNGISVGRVVCVPVGTAGRTAPRLCSGRSSDRFFLLHADRWLLITVPSAYQSKHSTVCTICLLLFSRYYFRNWGEEDWCAEIGKSRTAPLQTKGCGT